MSLSFLRNAILALMLAVFVGTLNSLIPFLPNLTPVMIAGAIALIITAFAARHPHRQMHYSALLAGLGFFAWALYSLRDPSVIIPVSGPYDVGLAVFGFGLLVAVYLDGRRSAEKSDRESIRVRLIEEAAQELDDVVDLSWQKRETEESSPITTVEQVRDVARAIARRLKLSENDVESIICRYKSLV